MPYTSQSLFNGCTRNIVHTESKHTVNMYIYIYMYIDHIQECLRELVYIREQLLLYSNDKPTHSLMAATLINSLDVFEMHYHHGEEYRLRNLLALRYII